MITQRTVLLARHYIAKGIPRETAALRALRETAAAGKKFIGAGGKDVRKSAWFQAMSKDAQAKYLKGHPRHHAGSITQIAAHDKYADWHDRQVAKGAGKARFALGNPQSHEASYHRDQAHKLRHQVARQLEDTHGDNGTKHEREKHNSFQTSGNQKHRVHYDRHYAAQNAHDDASDAFMDSADSYDAGRKKTGATQFAKAMQKRKHAMTLSNRTSLRGKIK